MKTYTLLIAIVFSLATLNLNAQCPTCVVDPGALTEPGLSPDPDSIPCIEQGVAYDQTIQLYNFDTVNFSGQLVFIDSLRVDSVGGLPTGIDWSTNNMDNTFINQERGCIKLCGTTNDPLGNYPLSIIATVWASFYPTGINFPLYPVTDVDASAVSDNLAVILQVINMGDPCNFNPGTGIEDLLVSESLSLIPNPAVNTAKVTFTSKEASDYVLSVVDMVGRTVVSRDIQAVPGENTYDIDVNELPNGVYMYSISNGRESISQKFVVTH